MLRIPPEKTAVSELALLQGGSWTAATRVFSFAVTTSFYVQAQL